jgi:hypothetical protein
MISIRISLRSPTRQLKRPLVPKPSIGGTASAAPLLVPRLLAPALLAMSPVVSADTPTVRPETRESCHSRRRVVHEQANSLTRPEQASHSTPGGSGRLLGMIKRINYKSATE